MDAFITFHQLIEHLISLKVLENYPSQSSHHQFFSYHQFQCHPTQERQYTHNQQGWYRFSYHSHPQLVCDSLNAVLPKRVIAEVRFTHNHHDR